MYCLTVTVPEPFLTALAQSRAGQVCDEQARSAAAYFGRAMARLAVGRRDDARDDFLEAKTEYELPCDLELIFLNLHTGGSELEAIADVRSLLKRVDVQTPLFARALHILGIAEQKAGNIPEAVDAFQQAAQVYHELNEPLGVAHVYDSHGQLETMRGRHDLAAQYFALSIAQKSLHGDEFGTAITLGNLGRVNLELGRIWDAISCFQSDLNIALRNGDRRGVAKMYDDLGRAYTSLKEHKQAEEYLQECLKICDQEGFDDIKRFTLKDSAINEMLQGKLNEAERVLSSIAQLDDESTTSYAQAVVKECWGDLRYIQGKFAEASSKFEEAVGLYEQDHLIDREIATRIKLARSLAATEQREKAQQCLSQGMRFTHEEGYARQLRNLREAILEIGFVEETVLETERCLIATEAATGTSYVKLNRLGSGSFGEVFRVFDCWRGDVVALKILHLDKVYDSTERERILASAKTELSVAGHVNHPGVVHVHAIGKFADGQVYIVQDYVAGKPLSEIMNTVTEEAAILAYVAKIADALQALHEAGIVHRDLKPANIIDRSGQGPVLIDFGIAHLPIMTSGDSSEILGTPRYMAPEQALGEAVDARADLYALGVIAYEWLAGTPPLELEGFEIEEFQRQLSEAIPRPLSQIQPSIRPAVEKLVMELLEKDPSHRPQSALEVAQVLRKLV